MPLISIRQLERQTRESANQSIDQDRNPTFKRLKKKSEIGREDPRLGSSEDIRLEERVGVLR